MTPLSLFLHPGPAALADTVIVGLAIAAGLLGVRRGGPLLFGCACFCGGVWSLALWGDLLRAVLA